MSLGRCNINDFNVISTFEVLGVNVFFLKLSVREVALNIVSTFTSQFFMLMGEAEETINTKCGHGGLLSTLDRWKFGCDIYYFGSNCHYQQ